MSLLDSSKICLTSITDMNLKPTALTSSSRRSRNSSASKIQWHHTPVLVCDLTYVQLISNAQTRAFEGVGGRKDLVCDLKEKWNSEQAKLITANTTHDQIWEQFKAHCKKELHKLDLQGFITKKTTNSARSTTSPTQEFNLELAQRLSGIESQVDALHDHQAHVNAAVSVIENNQRAFNTTAVPTCIQTDATNGNTSALGSDAITKAQCRRLSNEQQINMGKRMDAMALKNQELLAKI